MIQFLATVFTLDATVCDYYNIDHDCYGIDMISFFIYLFSIIVLFMVGYIFYGLVMIGYLMMVNSSGIFRMM